MAATTDLLTLTEAKAALNISSTAQDTEIAAYVTAVSGQLDELCGPVVTRTITSESHDGGVTRLFLLERPVATVTAVVEYDGTTGTALTAETPGDIAGARYLLDAAQGVLWRRVSGSDSVYPAGRRNVVVTYAAGRYTSTSTVDERFKTAARLCLTNLWRREQGGGTDTFGALPGTVIPGFGMPNAVMDLLSGDIHAPMVV
jgi:hypothetical protein